MYFPGGKDSALTTGTLRTFKTIPELSLTVPYNPFKVDIFQLGLTMGNLIDLNSIAARMSPEKLGAPILEKKGLVSYFVRKVVSTYRKDYTPPQSSFPNLQGSRPRGS
ncbi:hypothetical protein DFH09DRAFT_1454750 [Mycena vulgaris]|nr:hypothetical protein DFH09DRAFT_1454750 [Mycena vulgaris]